MKTILVPLGNSENAANTLQYAIDFATVLKAKIYVAQVFSSAKATGLLKNIDTVIESKTKEDLTSILAKVDLKNIEIQSLVAKGEIIDVISRASKELKVDFIIASANIKSADSSLYVGEITGGLVKQTELPLLIIPVGYKFKPFSNGLLGVRSGVIRKTNVLQPLQNLVSVFAMNLKLLHVITPHNSAEDNLLHQDFEAISDSISKSENATVYQGVLEHLIETKPDLLCVIRRKRGFFAKLWEQNSIKKIDFESRIPLLVLKGNL
ncbi:MAG: universal stress protein UspA [Lutibacter sp.]|nr:MAG: universal stress protein UspA [Lutibacter sp.]